MHILVLSVVAMVLFCGFAIIDSFAMPLDSGMVAGVSWKNWASVAASSVKHYMANSAVHASLDKLLSNPRGCGKEDDLGQAIGAYISSVDMEQNVLESVNSKERIVKVISGDNVESIVNLYNHLTGCITVHGDKANPLKYTPEISDKLAYGLHEVAYKFPNMPKSLLQHTAAQAKAMGSVAAEKFLGGTGGSYVIPEWVKNNAGWWSEGKITDQDFTSGLQYLIKEKIIKVPASNSDKPGSSEIPKWVKNVAKFWADGKTTAADFVNGIQYLITNNIIHVS